MLCYDCLMGSHKFTCTASLHCQPVFEQMPLSEWIWAVCFSITLEGQVKKKCQPAPHWHAFSRIFFSCFQSKEGFLTKNVLSHLWKSSVSIMMYSATGYLCIILCSTCWYKDRSTSLQGCWLCFWPAFPVPACKHRKGLCLHMIFFFLKRTTRRLTFLSCMLLSSCSYGLYYPKELQMQSSSVDIFHST